MELKDNTTIVILGASGDLAKKKTVCWQSNPAPVAAAAPASAGTCVCDIMADSTPTVPCALWSRTVNPPPSPLPLPLLTAAPRQYRNQFLPKDTQIVGYARSPIEHDDYIKRVTAYIKTPTKEIEQQLEEFSRLCTYTSGQYKDDESFQKLTRHIEGVEKGRAETNRLFYMALPPHAFIDASRGLKRNCYPQKGICRVIVRPSAASPRWSLST